jgi:hypothetical protein
MLTPGALRSRRRSSSLCSTPFQQVFGSLPHIHQSVWRGNSYTRITGPAILADGIRPFSSALGLTSLPLHIHEILFSALLYEFIFRVASPILSRWLAAAQYKGFSRRNRLNWDAHVVSMWQALFINTAALWVIWTDPQREVQNGDWRERLWGYNGAAGMVQGFAAGYFLWDVVTSCVHLDVMGLSSLIHAVSALGVTCIGFVSAFVHFATLHSP